MRLKLLGTGTQALDLSLQPPEPFLRDRVILPLQGLPFDFQLHDLALHLVDLGGHAVDLDSQPGRGFIDQVDRFVRQEAIADVAARKRGGRDDGPIGDAHSVVHFVPLFEAAQDRDSILHRRLADEDRLEPALQSGILLHPFAVLIDGRCAHAAQFAPRQRGL